MSTAIDAGWWFTAPTAAPDAPDAYCPDCARFLKWAAAQELDWGCQRCGLCGRDVPTPSLKAGVCVGCIFAKGLGDTAWRQQATKALEATLLFFQSGPWTEAKARRWKELTGATEATSRTLCDCVRLSFCNRPVSFESHLQTSTDAESMLAALRRDAGAWLAQAQEACEAEAVPYLETLVERLKEADDGGL